MSSTRSKLWWDVNSKGLVLSHFYDTACCNSCGLFLGMALLTACDCSQKIFHISEFFNFLGLQCTFGFTLTASHISFSGTHCPTSHRFFWELNGHLSGPTTPTFCILLKSGHCKWCQGLPIAQVVAYPSWILAASAHKFPNVGKSNH